MGLGSIVMAGCLGVAGVALVRYMTVQVRRLAGEGKPTGKTELLGILGILAVTASLIAVSTGIRGMDAHYEALARGWIMQINVHDDGSASIPTFRTTNATTFYYDACRAALARAGWMVAGGREDTELLHLVRAAAPVDGAGNDATLIERKRLKALFSRPIHPDAP